MENNAVLKDEIHELPFTTQLLPNYLSDEVKSTEHKKSFFQVKTLLESTIFTHISALHNVLSSTANDVCFNLISRLIYFFYKSFKFN